MRRCFVRGLHELQECDVLGECVCLTPCADGSGPSRVVDILNVTAGTWSAATLSAARYALAATSLPNLGVAIFAGGNSEPEAVPRMGGSSTCCLVCLNGCMRRCFV